MLKVETEDIISIKQIGFRRGCGTDINIVRLKMKMQEVKTIKRGHTKSVFFIDLKAAYDTVIHSKLFSILQEKGFDDCTISTIKLIYSWSKIRVGYSCDINVNSGVLQGSVISPMLFNIYIDGLVRELGNTCFEVLAYADDLAVICSSETELEKAIDVLMKWTEENGMQVNHKKSGILSIGKHCKPGEFKRGFPVVDSYNYLGVLLNQDCSPRPHVEKVGKRLQIYLRRTGKLMFKYFSPWSFLKIHEYFHRYRLLYGLGPLIDLHSVMEKVDSKILTLAKSVFKLPIQTSNERFRAAHGIANTKS